MKHIFIIVMTMLMSLGYAIAAYADASQAPAPAQQSIQKVKKVKKGKRPRYLIRPAMNARPGVMKVYSADNFGGDTFAFGYHGEYHQDYDTPFPGENRFYKDYIGLNYGPTKYLEFFLVREQAVNNNDRNVNISYYNGRRSSEVDLSIGNYQLGGKLTLPLFRDLKFAIEGDVRTYTDIKSEANFEGTSYGIRGLSTMNLGSSLFDNSYPILLHLNFQYFYNNSYDVVENRPNYYESYRYLGLTRFDRLNYGAALELQADALNPFIEWRLSQPLSDRVSFSEYPNVITVGTKINPGKERRFSANFGVDLGLTIDDSYKIERTPRYRFLFGLAYIIGGDRKMRTADLMARREKDSPKVFAAATPVALTPVNNQAKFEEDKFKKLREEIKHDLRQEFMKEKQEAEMKDVVDKAYEEPKQGEKVAEKPKELKPAPKQEQKQVEAQQAKAQQNQKKQLEPGQAAPQIYFVTIPANGGAGQIQQALPQQGLAPKKQEQQVKPKPKKKPEVLEEITTTTTRKIYKKQKPPVVAKQVNANEEEKVEEKKEEEKKEEEKKEEEVARVLPTTTKGKKKEQQQKQDKVQAARISQENLPELSELTTANENSSNEEEVLESEVVVVEE